MRPRVTVHPNATLYLAPAGFPRLIRSIPFRLGIVGCKLRVPQSEKSDIMKKTISMYWPLAVFAPLAAAAYLYACNETASRIAQPPLAAEQLTAELARTISYGLVGDDTASALKPMRAVVALPGAQAS